MLSNSTYDNYMHRCIALAEQGKGQTAPNPMVGAVLVSNGRVIGEGWHHFYGADHAEVNCLKNVPDADRHLIAGSTMYVNLEPCAHYGITPPCAGRLVEERIGHVVIANTDPFEQVSGRGISILQEAGIEVTTGVCGPEGLWLNRRFFCFHSHKRPYVILKWAETADGYIAQADRSRLQITCDESNLLVHKWRTQEAAIMVGHTTALMDNPRLTARHWQGRHPLRIVLDRHLQLPHTHHLFDNTAATWRVNELRETLEGNVHAVKLPFGDMLLPILLQRLYDHKILSIIIEGGASLLHSFISQGLWDEARVFTASAGIGDGLRAPRLADAIEVFAMRSGTDTLQLFTNNETKYPYANGMEL